MHHEASHISYVILAVCIIAGAFSPLTVQPGFRWMQSAAVAVADETADSIDPAEVETMYKRALRAVDSGNYHEAQQLLEGLADRHLPSPLDEKVESELEYARILLELERGLVPTEDYLEDALDDLRNLLDDYGAFHRAEQVKTIIEQLETDVKFENALDVYDREEQCGMVRTALKLLLQQYPDYRRAREIRFYSTMCLFKLDLYLDFIEEAEDLLKRGLLPVEKKFKRELLLSLVEVALSTGQKNKAEMYLGQINTHYPELTNTPGYKIIKLTQIFNREKIDEYQNSEAREKLRNSEEGFRRLAVECLQRAVKENDSDSFNRVWDIAHEFYNVIEEPEKKRVFYGAVKDLVVERFRRAVEEKDPGALMDTMNKGYEVFRELSRLDERIEQLKVKFEDFPFEEIIMEHRLRVLRETEQLKEVLYEGLEALKKAPLNKIPGGVMGEIQNALSSNGILSDRPLLVEAQTFFAAEFQHAIRDNNADLMQRTSQICFHLYRRLNQLEQWKALVDEELTKNRAKMARTPEVVDVLYAAKIKALFNLNQTKDALEAGLEILESYPQDTFPFRSGEVIFDILASLKKEQPQREMFETQHMEMMFFMKMGGMHKFEGLEDWKERRARLIEMIKTELSQ